MDAKTRPILKTLFDEYSRRFLDLIGDDILYCAEQKRWLIWQGTHWQTDRDNFVFDLASEFAAANNRAGFIELAQRRTTVSISQLDDSDATGRLLNCKNGTLDLRTGELRPHVREDRITRYVDCDYVADAEGDVFNRFLQQIQPDADIRAFLQRSVGYSLLGTVRERSFWILYGVGNNGKSVFTNLFNKLLGEYASITTTASIMQGRYPNDIDSLKGKRFIVVPETEENEWLNSALIKALSAGDKVTARFLFGEYFDFFFTTGKLWIATNHKPTVTDHSKGFWDRVKLIPFKQDIPAEHVIKSDDLMSMLMREREAVLAWAVRGARDYFEMDGLDVPPVIQSEIDKYRFEQEPRRPVSGCSCRGHCHLAFSY